MKEKIKKIISLFLRIIFRGKIVSKRFENSGMRLFYDKSQHLIFLRHKILKYENKIQKKLYEIVRKGDLVFDIGGNIGQYALFFSELTGAAGKVISIEPDVNNYAFLLFNITKNRCSNVLCINKGVSREDGEKVLYKDSITGGRKSSFLAEYPGDNYRGENEKVSVIKFKSLVEKFGIPDLVKMDTEGYERGIVEGISEIPDKTKFLIEVLDSNKKYIFERFRSEGFECFCAEKGDFSLIENIDLAPGGVINLLFLPGGYSAGNK